MSKTTARVIVLILGLCVGVSSVLSHPGIGIVMDSKGNVFYTDLKHVWKIAPDGKKSIAVHNVHTHELYIDSLDNLYGEHLWYNGEAVDTWGHRVWRLTPDGTVKDIVPARKGFLDDYDDFHFVHDQQGNFYWKDVGELIAIRKRSTDGNVKTIATVKFRDARWMTATSDGIVYVIDLYDLVRIMPDGKIDTVARDLAAWNVSRLLGPGRHAIMGLWTDTQANVYAAVFADRLVKKIDPDGHVNIIARSKFPWSPTGGLVAPNGDLWLLEYSTSNAARVRRIQKDGTDKMYE